MHFLNKQGFFAGQPYVTRVSTKNAMSSNLLDIDLDNAELCGVDRLKGATINLESYSVEEMVKKLDDILVCHQHLKKTGLVTCDKKPVVHLDICYE